MANNTTQIIKNAKNLINSNYYYVYGMKGQLITESIVRTLAARYPNIYSSSMLKSALSKVGKGYGIDCSGFVCKAAGVSAMGSYYIYTNAPHKWDLNDLSHIKNGMFIWVKGHIGLIEVDSNGDKWILEASISGIMRSSFSKRKVIFTHYGEIKGVDYSTKNESDKKDDWIARLQTALNKKGYKDKNGNKLKVDNIAGELTLSACPTRKYRTYLDPITKLIQERLKSLGYYSDAVTGNWGTKTNTAVYNYQLKVVKMKKPDKIFSKGGDTWAKLLGNKK